MSHRYRDDDDALGVIAGINVTPLVDIVLVLLIIFMVTAQIIAERGINVDNPDTIAGREIKGPLRVTINEDGWLFVDGKRVTDTQARERFETASRADPAVRAIVSADKKVAYGEVMAAIDLLKIAGITKVSLVTDDPASHSRRSP